MSKSKCWLMKLIQVTVKKFRSILDSTPVRIESDITCMVGKNESGKTSFLHSLYRLNPVRPNVKFKVEDQYPAWLEKKDRMKGEDLDKFKPITAVFEMTEDLKKEIEAVHGEGVLKDRLVYLDRNYGNELNHTFNFDFKVSVKNVLKDLIFSKEVRAELSKAEKVQDLKKIASEIKFPDEEGNEKDKENIAALLERIKKTYGDDSLTMAVTKMIEKQIPKFIYFDKYSSLPYTVKIKELLKADKSNLGDDELTALALLNMAGAEDDYLLNPDYERRKRELENVANALTQDVLKYGHL